MKIVPDTNVLLRMFRNPTAREDFEERWKRPLIYLSSVVVMELAAGCPTKAHESALAGFVRPFEKAGRLVTPDHGCYLEAGKILAGLADEWTGTAHLQHLTNDILIALCAARAGAVVVTDNANGFAKIAGHFPFRWIQPQPC